MNSFLFYDLETTGLNKSFDQILQFAAIRTDSHLNETDRYSLTIKLRPDVIPSPEASITHRISVAETQNGLNELEAVRHIHALMNTQGTISLGYNTLGFDDEFLRFSFYRNLLSPYSHQYANKCGRMDMLPVTVLYHLYKPDVIKWPSIDGRPTLKLEHLSSENSLASGRAHDAIVDVEATVELARRFYREKDMWDYSLGYFKKKTDTDRVNALPEAFESTAGIHSLGLMVDSKFGPDNLYQCPVIYIGNSGPYSNQSLWLRMDQSELAETKEETLEESTFVYRKRLGEPSIILPPAERFIQKLGTQRREIVANNLKWLQENKDLFYKIIKYYRDYRYPDVPDTDHDAALYVNGFLSGKDMKLCNKFHHLLPDKGLEIVDQFQDMSLKQLAMRMIFRNYDECHLQEVEAARQRYFKKVNPQVSEDGMVDFKGERRLTPDTALAGIARLRDSATLDPEQSGILDELEIYLKEKFYQTDAITSGI